jgi:hypothetical protein
MFVYTCLFVLARINSIILTAIRILYGTKPQETAVRVGSRWHSLLAAGGRGLGGSCSQLSLWPAPLIHAYMWQQQQPRALQQ